MDTHDRSPRSFRPGAVFGGLLLLVFGAALLLDRSLELSVSTGRLIGPVVLILLGAALTFDRAAFVCSIPAKKPENGDVAVRMPGRRRSSTGGLWLIGIGVWMLTAQNHFWGLTFETSWPLLLVFMGIMIVIRGWR